MRCMACGEQMLLMEVVPDESAEVTGFEHETLHCPACRTTERRLVFSRGPRQTIVLSAAALDLSQSVGPPSPRTESFDPVGGECCGGASGGTEPARTASSSPEPLRSESSGTAPAAAEFVHAKFAASSLASSPASSRTSSPASSACSEPPPATVFLGEGTAAPSAWSRAVEKLRSRQADLHERASEAKKMDWRSQFDQAWENLGTRSSQSAPSKLKDVAWSSARSLRAQLRKRSIKVGRREVSEPIVRPDREAVEQFNQLWDSLASGYKRPGDAPNAVPALRPAPLPRSLSLVAVESVTAAGRVILLLRGTRQLSA